LVKRFELQRNINDTVQGSGGEELPTFFADAEVVLFVEDPGRRKHGLRAMARGLSGLAPSLDAQLARSPSYFLIAGPSMMKAWRLTIIFDHRGVQAIRRCAPTVSDILSTWGSFRDTLDESCKPSGSAASRLSVRQEL
jgi:hypothetical protein